MENFYTAYTKVIENKTYYFVKKFMAFPEFQGVEPVLESYAMHTDFNKACTIAGILDQQVKARLLKEANETLYWLELLNQGGYIGKASFESIRSDSDEVVKLLVAIVKTAKVAKRSE